MKGVSMWQWVFVYGAPWMFSIGRGKHWWVSHIKNVEQKHPAAAGLAWFGLCHIVRIRGLGVSFWGALRICDLLPWSKMHVVRTKCINHHCFWILKMRCFFFFFFLTCHFTCCPFCRDGEENMKIQTTKLRMIFLSCQEKCVSQLCKENSSSLTELLDFKVVVHEASCVGPSVFLSLEVSLLMFSLTFVWSHSLQDVQVSAPFDCEHYCPSSCLWSVPKD